MPHYAVRVGRRVGVYTNWTECEQQVKGHSGAEYKKFSTRKEADDYIGDNGNVSNNVVDNQHHSINQSTNQLYTDLIGISLMSDRRIDYSDMPSAGGQLFDAVVLSLGYQSSNPINNTRTLPTSPSIIMYTDGSCRANGTPQARGGYGIYCPTHPQLTSYGPLDKSHQHTNQRAELTAILIAIQSVPDCPLQIITDSMYSINCITKWSMAWERSGWNVDKCNLDLIRPIKELLRGRIYNVEFTHVRGHKGDYGNEEADRLANMGADMVV